MSKSDLTQEEQEAIQKSKDPFNCYDCKMERPIRQKKQQFMSVMLDMFVQVQLLKESPAVLSL